MISQGHGLWGAAWRLACVGALLLMPMWLTTGCPSSAVPIEAGAGYPVIPAAGTQAGVNGNSRPQFTFTFPMRVMGAISLT